MRKQSIKTRSGEQAKSYLPDRSELFGDELRHLEDSRSSVIEEAEHENEQANPALALLRKKQKQKKELELRRARQEQVLIRRPAVATMAARYDMSRPVTEARLEMLGREGIPSALQEVFVHVGLDMDLTLTRSQTRDMVAAVTLLNEDQLDALCVNRRTPAVVKTIARAVLRDMEKGNLSTVDRLWDRLFGGTFEEPQPQPSTVNLLSVLPGVDGTRPVSREGYDLLRRRLLGEGGQE